MSLKAARPFLKWAGGKTQLLTEINEKLPVNFGKNKFTYVEPFVGSGAMLFHIASKFTRINKIIINDINPDLINVYRVIANNHSMLIEILSEFQANYHALESKPNKKKEYYYYMRDLYNQRCSDQNKQAALFIFLNKTCFNGLYRVNKQNDFNVPIGKYNKPSIFDKENIILVSQIMRDIVILNGDFELTYKGVTRNSFFYFDPPYKPISVTSNFNSYANTNFDDKEQHRLKQFCDKLSKDNIKWLLSNSDAMSSDETSSFFDLLYSEYIIERVKAKRFINSNSSKRGEINELLIRNYE